MVPLHYTVAAEQLNALGLQSEADGWSRLVVEKPFGFDLESAQALDRRLHVGERTLRRPWIWINIVTRGAT